MTAKTGRTAPALLTAKDVAARLTVDLKTVRRHTRRGDYNAFALNLGTENAPQWRYDADLLEAWIDTRRAA